MSNKVLISVKGKPMTAIVTQMADTKRFVAALDTTDTTVFCSGDTREEAADALAEKLSK